MLVLVVPLVLGVVAGFFLRGKWHFGLGKVTFGVILILIFSLGFSIGSDNELLASFPSVGVSALALALFGIGFSVLFVVFVRRWLRL
jgi:Lysine exporter LysO